LPPSDLDLRSPVGCSQAPASDPQADERLPGWIGALRDEVAALLHVPTRPIRVRVVQHGRHVARTRMAFASGVPEVTLSRDCLTRSVVAHELAHCLVPSPWLLVAEGLATWVGCTLAGECGDLLFSEPSLDEVVAHHWGGRPSVDDLAGERVDTGHHLAPSRFHHLECRVAHAVAGSWTGYWLRAAPWFPGAILRHHDLPITELVRRTTGLSLASLVERWRASLSAGTP
jgi:hypothetical protein